ncbi:MAG: aminoglycoside phosphotransferase family protein, partial [Ktedonobacteraceae bacterium]
MPSFRVMIIEKFLQADKDHAVLLLERVIPGVPLSTLEDDEEATRILASVMKNLWKPLPEKHDFITIAEWSNAISQYHGTSGPLPSYLVDRAERLFAELIASSAEPVLVHGDLHHENVLSSARAGWLAIDPKGVAAEPAYETAALLRNPRSKLQQHPELEQILLRRILVLSEALHPHSAEWLTEKRISSKVRKKAEGAKRVSRSGVSNRASGSFGDSGRG